MTQPDLKKLTPKIARTSNLAMRFYELDGWTKDELDSLCTSGSFSCKFPDDQDKYWILDTGSAYDVDKMMEAISEVQFAFKDQVKSKRAILEEMNW